MHFMLRWTLTIRSLIWWKTTSIILSLKFLFMFLFLLYHYCMYSNDVCKLQLLILNIIMPKVQCDVNSHKPYPGYVKGTYFINNSKHPIELHLKQSWMSSILKQVVVKTIICKQSWCYVQTYLCGSAIYYHTIIVFMGTFV
jgi:hypothetical protein